MRPKVPPERQSLMQPKVVELNFVLPSDYEPIMLVQNTADTAVGHEFRSRVFSIIKVISTCVTSHECGNSCVHDIYFTAFHARDRILLGGIMIGSSIRKHGRLSPNQAHRRLAGS